MRKFFRLFTFRIRVRQRLYKCNRDILTCEMLLKKTSTSTADYIAAKKSIQQYQYLRHELRGLLK